MSTTPAVELRGADCGYRGVTVLADVDLCVQPGEFLGAVGPSGSGKTTLIRALTGRCDVDGTVHVFGRPVDPRRPSVRLGYVPQVGNVDLAFPISVREIVLQGLGDRGSPLPRGRAADRRAVGDLLERLHIGQLSGRPLGELSGGELQRTFLARALIGRPQLLLLDEPTSGVDLKTRHDVLHLLGELHEQGMTIVLTTHDLNFVAAHLPRIVCLAGRVVADGAPAEVFRPDVIRATYGAEVKVIADHGLVFVADPTHLLTPRSHHDPHDHRLAPVPGEP
ncbi:MAG: metal ABC transporter ATP-binding protein [Actinomycetota bacterium]|nr:metal ABC transporter ATP-binding protein [Actinomycetota bacterium]